MIDEKTKLLGIIGYPIGHTISPLLHNSTLKELGLNYSYLAFQIHPEELAEAVAGLKVLKARGFNVTIPHKERVITYLDRIDPLAARIGAVNTVVNDNGVLTGYNTDLYGLVRMIQDDGGFDIKGKKAMILGAGGAARAAGVALLSENISELYLLNRTPGKAVKLVEEWRRNYPETVLKSLELQSEVYGEMIAGIDLLIDTTPVGMAPNTEIPPLIASEYLHSNMLVVDLVYNPEESTQLRAARKAGAAVLNGMDMLLYQGIEAFRLWTGCEIDPLTWWKLLKKER